LFYFSAIIISKVKAELWGAGAVLVKQGLACQFFGLLLDETIALAGSLDPESVTASCGLSGQVVVIA
jgi:hypothetical protein